MGAVSRRLAGMCPPSSPLMQRPLGLIYWIILLYQIHRQMSCPSSYDSILILLS